MCFAIRGLPAVIDTSLPHGYKKSEPYKASYSPDWNGCGQKATAVRPRLCIPVSVMVLISATANPGSSACCAAVLQGDRKSTRLNSSHRLESRMPSSA